MSDPAELNGPFIGYILGKIFDSSVNYREVTPQNVQNIGSPNYEGLYMFFVKLRTEQHYCPIYVGYTGRNFRQRFGEHTTNGVIYKFGNGQLQATADFHPVGGGAQAVCDLYVSEFVCDAPAAKLLESVFLKAFNFALNVAENDKERDTVETAVYKTPEQSYDFFVPAFEKVMQDVTKMEESVRSALNLPKPK